MRIEKKVYFYAHIILIENFSRYLPFRRREKEKCEENLIKKVL